MDIQEANVQNDWFPELQQGHVSGQVLLTILTAFAIILSNL